MLRKIENLPANVLGVRAEGEVTKADGKSVTVKSDDGFSATYTTDADTRTTGAKDLATGDSVLVVARKDGAVAVLIRHLGR